MTSERLAQHRVRILAVIVLFKTQVSECVSVQSLVRAANEADCDLHLLLVDNSPVVQTVAGLPVESSYLHWPANLGLANAYNRAIEMAERKGYEWLLTLDQDTSLPGDFMSSFSQIAGDVRNTPSIAAIVPQVVADGTLVSPNYFALGAIARWFPLGFTGVSRQPTFAFNSGSMIRVDVLRQVNGYDPYFWLDNSDASIFRSLHHFGKKVYVAGHVRVDHDFSMKNMGERVSLWRYRQILLAECAFWAAEMNELAGLERTARLVLRIGKHWLRRDNWSMQKITLRFLAIRLFRSRAYQIRIFRDAVEQHIGANFPSTALKAGTMKISVCMAAYNGGAYVEEQLSSILQQIGSNDELVIVDDCSTDDTVRRIVAQGDGRIRLIHREVNVGVVAAFDEAVRNATGDFLFLSDNDDVWAQDKVARMVDEFSRDPRVNLVISAVQLINSSGVPFSDRRFDRGGMFRAGFWSNVLRNNYQGSAMAFRSTLLRRVLPFPRNKAFLHDAWIGTVHDRVGGKTVFIPEPLLLYRRHGGNVSQSSSIWKRIQSRSQLLIAHLAHICK